MSNQSIISSGPAGAQPSGGLQDFIVAYKQYLHGHFKDVNDGENMLQMGAKTALVQELEQWLTNPIEGILSIHLNAEGVLLKSVEGLMNIFFKKGIENNFIKGAYKISSTNNSLSYGIVLHKDTFKNREEVLNFLSLYYTFDLAEKIEVYFQFIPDGLKSAFDKVA